MSLSPQFLDEIRARTSLSTVIGRTVKLQKAGREWKAPCPFHKEKTPSFYVNDEKSFYHCLAGETRVITRAGRVEIASLKGQTVDILTRGSRWVPAAFKDFGVQRLWEIRLSRNGVKKSLFATSGHRWFVRGSRGEVLTEQLRMGHRLESVLPPACTHWELDPEGVRHGIVFGDGYVERGAYGTVNLHGSKDADLACWFPGEICHPLVRENGQPYLRVYGGRGFSTFKTLPTIERPPSYRLGFLAGLIAADGHVAKDGTVLLNSASRQVLEEVRDLAGSLGIATFGLTSQMRRGLGRADSFIHRIHFVTSTLDAAIFLLPQARQRFQESSKAFDRLRWTVTGVEATNRVERVYCAEVPGEHAFAIEDNILTGNCFGCGVHGDAIRWLTDARGLPFMDAVKELADAAGMEVPAADPRAQERAEKATGLYDVMASAQNWFEEQLAGLEGAEARAYLETRGISEPTRRRFGFGYAPDARGKLRTALKNFGNEALVEAGLLIVPEGEREPYDRFRGRLMFPIRDRRGRVIAFSARILGAGEPKYLNSPDTPLFDKGRTLFNIDKAAAASREAKRVIVVEGQMDVIALDQAGLGEAVAPLGTAVTETQLGLLWRLSPTPIFCFDGDSAGQKAAVRALLRALPHVGPDRSLSFATLPAGQDPDDLIRGEGRQGIEALLETPESLVDRLWHHELKAEPLVTPEQRAGLRHRLSDHVATIQDPHVREQYRTELLGRFNVLTAPPPRPPWKPGSSGAAGFRGGGKFVPKRPVSDQAKALASAGMSPETARSVLHGLLRFPELVAAHAEAIGALPISDKMAARLRDALLEGAMAHGELDQEQVLTILAEAGVAPLAERLRLERGLAFSFNRRDADPERASRDLVLVIDTLAAQPGLYAALDAATARLKEEGDEAAFQEQQRLRAARDEAERQLAALIESGAGG